MTDKSEPAGRSTRCPKCGLVLQVVASGDAPELRYDFAAWNSLCKTPGLGGPSMCLSQASDQAAEPADRDDPTQRYDRRIWPPC